MVTQIEIIYAVLIGLLIAIAIATYYGKLNLGIGIIGLLAGIGIAWFFADWMMLVMTPLGNSIWYGYPWTLLSILALIQIITMCAMVGMAFYNLYKSGGRIVWA